MGFGVIGFPVRVFLYDEGLIEMKWAGLPSNLVESVASAEVGWNGTA